MIYSKLWLLKNQWGANQNDGLAKQLRCLQSFNLRNVYDEI